MITYNDIADHNDRKRHRKIKLQLGKDKYFQLVPIAKLMFQQALKEPDELKRNNAARKAYNMVFTIAISKLNK